MDITLPDDVVYFWWMAEGGQTELVWGRTVRVPTQKRIKVVSYREVDDLFLCAGNSIFIIVGPGSSKVGMTWPRGATGASTTTPFHRNMRYISVSGASRDLAIKYEQELRICMRGAGKIYRMNKFWKVDWEWPFQTPGWIGLREIGTEIPGWQAAVPWLEYHGLSVMGKTSRAECTPGEWKSVVGLALGAAGYLDGYDSEPVDDTTPRWSSFGTGDDCDDFAVAAAQLVTSLRRAPGDTDLGRWVHENVKDHYIVSGIAWPRNAVKNGQKVTFGHMWMELVLRDGKCMVVECTAAVAYYGGTPVCNNARVGYAQGSMNEYLSRENIWYADKAFKVVDGKRQKLELPEMPTWLFDLRFTPPAETLDKVYKKPPPPPRPQPAISFHNTRKKKERSGVVQRIFPFSRGEVVWTCDAGKRSSKFGSFA